VVAVDTSWYLDVNRFARSTPWLHGFMAYYAERALYPVGAGLLVLGALVLAAWLTARAHPDRLPGVALTAVAALAALGLQRAVAPALGLHHPELARAETLLPKPTSYALPDARTAMAGAVVAGLGLSRRRWLSVVALVAALLLAFSRVYVGADFPSDVVAGLGYGALLTVVMWPVGARLATVVLSGLAGGRLGVLVAGKRVRQGPARPVSSFRLAQARLPSARAMDALRAASEAARHANVSALERDDANGGAGHPTAPRRT
jgi:membrane-associated phospholipid phosphatase